MALNKVDFKQQKLPKIAKNFEAAKYGLKWLRTASDGSKFPKIA